MPDNPISGKAGNTTRLNQLLSNFNENENLEVTFVSLRDWGMWNNNDEVLFKQKYPNISFYSLDKKYKKNFFKYFFLYKIPYFFKNNSIDLTSFILRKEFSEIIKKNSFDTAIISYAVWGKLVEGLSDNVYKIIDTHDFITAQSRDKENKIGKLFQDEINILRKFNEIWTYSIEEAYIFEQFTGKKITLMPVSFPFNYYQHTNDFKYDVIYVASDNQHNITGIHWFLHDVLPSLNNINIHLIGKICNTISEEYPNVIKHGVVDDIDSFYKKARIAICPMLSGTGIKIKVLEALSFGLPVVTNRRGVDGLINKTNNGCVVAEDSQDFANAITRLISDNNYYERIKSNGINYFSENHNPETEKKIISISL